MLNNPMQYGLHLKGKLPYSIAANQLDSNPDEGERGSHIVNQSLQTESLVVN